MKNIHKIVTLSVLGIFLSLTSCTEDPITSTVTYYPDIQQNLPDATTIFVEQGEVFNEPGAIATENGAEIPVTTTYVGRYRGNSFTLQNIPLLTRMDFRVCLQGQ
jgi:hypothetical protein